MLDMRQPWRVVVRLVGRKTVGRSVAFVFQLCKFLMDGFWLELGQAGRDCEGLVVVWLIGR